MPGDPVELHVTIINQGEQSAVIDLFLDEGLEILTRSQISPRESLALDPQQSQEVTFRFEIPIDTLPGTYDYTLVVDSPNHYPQYTP
ncbi:MAG: COG1470 family protein, partial [Nostoc sp.]